MKRQFNKSVFSFPYIAISVIFVIFPLILVLIYAFKGDVDGKFTFSHFTEVFTNPNNYLSLLKTIGTALLSTAICLVVAYPIAYVLASSQFNKYAILALLFVVPMWMNFVLRMLALKEFLYMLGIANSYPAAILGLVYDFLPFMLLPIYTILVNMDKSYVEASSDLGANPVKTFLRVTLPLSVPGIISGVLMVFMPVFSAYAVTDMLGGVNSSVIGLKIYDLFINDQWGAGSALSFVLLLIVLITMFLGNFISGRAKLKSPAKSVSEGGRML